MWVMVSLIALPGLLNWAAMRWHAARQRLRKGSNIRIWHNLHQGSRLRKFGGRVVPYSGGMLITERRKLVANCNEVVNEKQEVFFIYKVN